MLSTGACKPTRARSIVPLRVISVAGCAGSTARLVQQRCRWPFHRLILMFELHCQHLLVASRECVDRHQQIPDQQTQNKLRGRSLHNQIPYHQIPDQQIPDQQIPDLQTQKKYLECPEFVNSSGPLHKSC